MNDAEKIRQKNPKSDSKGEKRKVAVLSDDSDPEEQIDSDLQIRQAETFESEKKVMNDV